MTGDLVPGLEDGGRHAHSAGLHRGSTRVRALMPEALALARMAAARCCPQAVLTLTGPRLSPGDRQTHLLCAPVAPFTFHLLGMRLRVQQLEGQDANQKEHQEAETTEGASRVERAGMGTTVSASCCLLRVKSKLAYVVS